MTDSFAPDPITPKTTNPDPLATDATSVSDAPSTTGAAAKAADKDKALTPLYAAAGLVEVVATQLRDRLGRTQAQAQGGTLPATAKSRVAELQQQFKTYSDKVTQGYNSLATRGKPTVDSTLVTVRHLSGRAERKVEEIKDDVSEFSTRNAQRTPEETVVVQPVVVQPVENLDATESDRTNRDGF
jgi:hypothetical protein